MENKNEILIPEFIFDEKKKLKFIELFEDEKSLTYGDIYSSAVKAGFSTGEAKLINNFHYAQMKSQQQRILKKAQDELERQLGMNTTTITEFGEEEDTNKNRLKQQAAMFALETLGKKDYSKKIEQDSNVNVHVLPTPILDAMTPKE